MKNHPNTQERSPNSTDSTSPIIHQQNKSLVANHPWLLVVGLGMLLMAIAVVAILSLTSIGSGEKDPTKQTTIVNQKPTPTKSKSNSSLDWLPTILLLSVAGASTVAIYKWRQHLPIIAKRGLTRRQQRKLLLQQGRIAATPINTPEITPENNSLNSDIETVPEALLEDQFVEPVLMDVSPTISVLPPEEAQANNLGSQSLAEMMDIRKHLSLAAILQFHPNKK